MEIKFDVTARLLLRAALVRQENVIQPALRNSRNILVNGRPTRLIEVIPPLLGNTGQFLPTNISETERSSCVGHQGHQGQEGAEDFHLELQHNSGLVSEEKICQSWGCH